MRSWYLKPIPLHRRCNSQWIIAAGHAPARPCRIPAMHSLPDAHAHPQDDLPNASRLLDMRTPFVAVMGTREDDWEAVLQLQRMAPLKVIPCFGVHPWFAHLHAAPTADPSSGSRPGSPHPPTPAASDTSESTPAQARSDTNSISSPSRPPAQAAQAAPAAPTPRGSDGSGGGQSMYVVPAGQDPAVLQGLLANPPSHTWAARLEELLKADAHAVVGECGLDRAAVIPGTKVAVSLEHQLALVRHHLLLAARMQRPISMHCVRATGAMQALLQSLAADQLPPRIMLHSFGGPPEAIRQLLGIRAHGLGGRLWFSFSAAINLAKGNRDKLIERVRAVPQDRLLIESDQDSVLRMEAGLETILELVAEAHGWSMQQAEEVAVRNFNAFYEGFLPGDRDQPPRQ